MSGRVETRETPVISLELSKYPLCSFFLSEYLKRVDEDLENFPATEFPNLFQRYESVLSSGLLNLSISKEEHDHAGPRRLGPACAEAHALE